MQIIEPAVRGSQQIQVLTALWDRSVRATHKFLSDTDRAAIALEVPGALAAVPQLAVAVAADGGLLGFMGANDRHLEMLFLDPAARGQGVGGTLLRYGVRRWQLETLTVNEQNHAAVGFYRHMGFVAERRSDTDQQGRPFALLYMRRADESTAQLPAATGSDCCGD